MTLRWTPSAADDLEEIARYLHTYAPAVAQAILRRIYEGIASLEEMPYKGRRFGDEGMRQLVFAKDPYTAIYFVEGETVHVLGVRHTSRRPFST